MNKNSRETRTLLLMALLALSLAAWGYSVVLLVAAGEAGPGRMVGFLGWQAVAGMLAFACWAVGWPFAQGTGIRRVSGVPVVMAFALGLVVLGLALFGG